MSICYHALFSCFLDAHAGPKIPEDLHQPTLVLDLDETLVHSSFKPIPNPDYIIPVDIDGKVVDVYVLKVSGEGTELGHAT